MLEEVKSYLRIDGSEEDSLLATLIEASKLFMKNATGKEIVETNAIHKLGLMLFVNHSYENRLPIGKQGENLTFSLQNILLQIQYSDDVIL